MTAPVLSYENLGLVQGSGWLFRDLNIYVGASDRLALIGRNGAGKTTLMKLLAGRIEPDEGKRVIVPGTNVVILEQEPDFRPFATLMDFATHGPGAPAEHAVEAIASQLGIDMARAAASASGGERRRAAIARAIALEPDVLLMDEPTNDLDLETLDLLQEVIADYDGTVLLVSHDRDFLDRTVTVTLGLDGSGKVDIVAGGYADWEAKRAPVRGAAKTVAKVAAPASTPAPRKKLSYKDQRDYDLLPARIEEIDRQVAAAEAELADGSLFTRDHARFAALTAKLDALRAEKDAAEERWLMLAEMVEGLG